MSIINSYSVEELSSFVKETYDMNVSTISATSYGLDNSVYIIESDKQKKYVLKIVETKPKEQIEKAIGISKSLGEDFCRLEYISTLSGEEVASFKESKPAFLYSYRDGTRFSPDSMEDIKHAAEFLRELHLKGRQPGPSAQKILDEFREEIELYTTPKVTQAADRDFSKEFNGLNKEAQLLQSSYAQFQDAVKHFTLHKGFVHSDFTPDNLLVNNGKLELLDFDAVKTDGLQIVDVLQFASKTGLVQNEKKLALFFNTYNGRDEGPEALRAFKAMLLPFSMKCLLSTLYYTEDIGKINVEWVKKNAMYTLDPLYKSVTSLRRQLIP